MLHLLAVAQGAEPLRVAMSGDYPPLHARDAGGFVGFEPDLAALLAEQLGRTLVLVDARAQGVSTLQAVAQGKADIAMNAITDTPGRRETVDFTLPYLTLRYRLAGLDPSVDLASFDDAVAVADDLTARAVAEHVPGAKIVRVPSLQAALVAFARTEVDWIAGEDVALVQALSGSRLQMSAAAFGTSAIAMATPKGGASPYDAALAELDLAPLQQRWRPGELPEGERPAWGGELLARLPRVFVDVEDMGHNAHRLWSTCGGEGGMNVSASHQQVSLYTTQSSVEYPAISAALVGDLTVVRTPKGILRWPVLKEGVRYATWDEHGHLNYFVLESERALPIERFECRSDSE